MYKVLGADMNYEITLKKTSDNSYHAFCAAVSFGASGSTAEGAMSALTAQFACYLHDPEATFEILSNSHPSAANIVLSNYVPKFMGMLVLAGLCLFAAPVFAADVIVASTDTAKLVLQLKSAANPRVKMQIIEALTLRQSSTTLAAVVSMLDDKNPQVRQSALINLAYFGVNASAIEHIRASLEAETDENAQLAALNTLAVFKSSASINTIDATIERRSFSSRVRSNAYHLLEKNGSKDALDRLKKHVKPVDDAPQAPSKKKKQ